MFECLKSKKKSNFTDPNFKQDGDYLYIDGILEKDNDSIWDKSDKVLAASNTRDCIASLIHKCQVNDKEIKSLKAQVATLAPEFKVIFEPEGHSEDFILQEFKPMSNRYDSIAWFESRKKAEDYIEVIKRERAIDAS